MPRSYYFLICAFMATFFSCTRFAKMAIKNYKESRKSKNIRNYWTLDNPKTEDNKENRTIEIIKKVFLFVLYFPTTSSTILE